MARRVVGGFFRCGLRRDAVYRLHCKASYRLDGNNRQRAPHGGSLQGRITLQDRRRLVLSEARLRLFPDRHRVLVRFHGKQTANGETFDMNLISAAHRTLALPSIVRVTNLQNGRSLKVRVNDRGPYARGRIIDLSRRTAQLLGFEQAGTATVRVSVLARESRQLAAEYGVFDALENEPPRPVAAPRVAVTSATLPPPPGAKTAPPPTNNHKVVAVNTVPKRKLRDKLLVPVVDDAVTILLVKDAPKIFVQAGAFTRYDNANRLRARLSPIGSANIFQARIVDRPFFRVRFGPLNSVEEADRLLASIVRVGQRKARIVVE